MDVIEELARRDGVARVATLRAVGITAYRLREAVRSGQIHSVCRGWVALRSADRMLVAAARNGVVLSCITLAARMGLWVLDATEPHVAAPPKSGHAKVQRGVIHWRHPVFPRDPDLCVDSIENALILIACCQPYESAMATWESALRQRKVDPEVLVRAPLPAPARRLLDDARPFADSGTETIFLTRLRWLNVPITPQIWIIDRPVDFLIGERLVIQIDGGHHVGAQRARDIAHDAELRLRGYHVIRITYDQLMNQWPWVQRTILASIAQRLHLA